MLTEIGVGRTFQFAVAIFVSLLIFCFPLFSLHVDHWASTTSALLMISILTYPFLRHTGSLSDMEKRIVWVVSIFLIVLVINYIFVDQSDFNYSRLRRYARVLAIIPIIYVLNRVRPGVAWLWYGITVGAIVIGGLAIWEYLHHQHPAERVAGNTHPITFGCISLVLATMCLMALPYYRNISKKLIILPIFACLLGLTAAILSETRGAWVAAPVLVLFLTAFYRHKLGKVGIFIIAVTVLGASLFLYFMPDSSVKRRIARAGNEVSAFVEKGDINTSIGARLEMWRLGIQIFTENPIFGAGASEFKKQVASKIAKKQYSEFYRWYSEPHNEYIATLSSRGLIGLVALLALLVLPLRFFWQVFRMRKEESAMPALAGLILVISFAIYGLTASVLDMTRMVTFFAFYLGVLTSYAARGADS